MGQQMATSVIRCHATFNAVGIICDADVVN